MKIPPLSRGYKYFSEITELLKLYGNNDKLNMGKIDNKILIESQKELEGIIP